MSIIISVAIAAIFRRPMAVDVASMNLIARIGIIPSVQPLALFG
jgi:hypothetical protein